VEIKRNQADLDLSEVSFQCFAVIMQKVPCIELQPLIFINLKMFPRSLVATIYLSASRKCKAQLHLISSYFQICNVYISTVTILYPPSTLGEIGLVDFTHKFSPCLIDRLNFKGISIKNIKK
jgi:hypothetical protein